MAFKAFTRKDGNESRMAYPMIMLRTSGVVKLNRLALDLCEIKAKESQYVALYYDEESHSIGLRFHKEREDGFYKLCLRNSDATFTFKKFAERYGIDLTVTRKYLLSYDGAEDLYVVHLDEP